MNRTEVTRQNAHTFKIGSRVEFNYGPMHGSEQGVIVGWETTEWGTNLLARTDDGKEKKISSFTNMGIGAYLLN